MGWRPQLRGRTYDLRSAYKQFAVHPSDRRILRMGVNVPGEKQCAIIGFNSLPFGVAQWQDFCVSARPFGIWDISAWDFFGVLSMMTTPCFRGWNLRTAAAGLARPFAFASRFKALGLEIDVEDFRAGHVLVGHTDSRKEELHSQLSSFLKVNAMTAKEAERMRGRMIFFEGYTFGSAAPWFLF